MITYNEVKENEAIKEYIKEQLKKGVPKTQIARAIATIEAVLFFFFGGFGSRVEKLY